MLPSVRERFAGEELTDGGMYTSLRDVVEGREGREKRANEW
jgi:hypothetical protein